MTSYNKLLVFDISSEYGHFRKFNTTSSPLTYSLPPRSALSGLLGAILGIERETNTGVFGKDQISVNELFAPDVADFAIQVLHPIRKTNIGFNLLNTKKSFFNIEQRTQIEFELLKEPKFRVFLGHSDEAIFNELAERIRVVNHHFTPYLGLSQFTATVDFVDIISMKVSTNKEDFAPINTAINLSKLASTYPIEFQKGNHFYSVDTFPMAMSRNRVITEYAEILIEKNGQSTLTRTDIYGETELGNILFL
jgi:CRISPR-associated protein Cas5h